jgi:large subunit ribosomal protein L3
VTDAIKLPRHDSAPYPAGLIDTKAKIDESELPAAGLVDDAAVHEIPALPGDDEVAAIAAEQEAGGALDSETEAAAENEATEAPADEAKPDADESKES